MVVYKNGKEVKVGQEVIVGSGDYRQYMIITKVTDNKVYGCRAGHRRASSFDPAQVRDQHMQPLELKTAPLK